MTSLQKERRGAKSEHQRDVTGRIIFEVDRQIDRLVATLFTIDLATLKASEALAESDA